MYLIARPSVPPLYPPPPPSPLYLYLSERGRRGGAGGGGGGGGGGAVPPGSWGRWRSVTDGAESQNSQPRAKFIPQNFPQGAQIYLIREMWREGCVFQCVCVCVCVGLQKCAEEAEEAWPPVMADTEPICLKPVAPSTTSSPLTQTHTHTLHPL